MQLSVHVAQRRVADDLLDTAGLAGRSPLAERRASGDTGRAMSQENVEIVRRLYAEFLARPERMMDPAISQFFDPAVELRQSASIFGTEGTFHGYDGLIRAAREVFETFRDLHFVPIRLIDAGDHVVATVDAHGYGKHSDAEVNATVGHVWTLRGGRIVAWHVHMDPADALEAAGLRE